MTKSELDIDKVLSDIEQYIRDPAEVMKRTYTKYIFKEDTDTGVTPTLPEINSLVLYDAARFLFTLKAWCTHYSTLDDSSKGLYVHIADEVPGVQFAMGVLLKEIMEAQKAKS